MRVAIVTTGDEIIQGVVVNTNAAWLSERCHAVGHEVVWHVAVADDVDIIGGALQEAVGRADCVLVSGGLGPTADDVTIEAAAKIFRKNLIVDQEVLTSMEHFFERMGRPMSASNRKQALIPEGGRPLTNRVGTAPGIRVTLGHAETFFLPGVPKELYQIFEESVMPWLNSRREGAMVERVVRCFGTPEASIDERLQGVSLGDVRLSFRVRFPEVLLKVIARAANEQEASERAASAVSIIRMTLGDVVYGEGDELLAAVVGKKLRERGMTIAIAESCTGGLVGSLFTDIAGSSEYFERGVVCYSNRSKMDVLGVTEEVLRANGAVSRETAMAMAEGVRTKSGASLGLAVTGIAGPGGGTPEKPVGTVHLALASERETQSGQFLFSRDRIEFKQIVAWTAIDMVRKSLL